MPSSPELRNGYTGWIYGLPSTLFEMMEQFDHEFTRADSVLAGREITVYQECKRVIETQSAKDSYLISGVHGNYIVDLASSIINDKRETKLLPL